MKVSIPHDGTGLPTDRVPSPAAARAARVTHVVAKELFMVTLNDQGRAVVHQEQVDG